MTLHTIFSDTQHAHILSLSLSARSQDRSSWNTHLIHVTQELLQLVWFLQASAPCQGTLLEPVPAGTDCLQTLCDSCSIIMVIGQQLNCELLQFLHTPSLCSQSLLKCLMLTQQGLHTWQWVLEWSRYFTVHEKCSHFWKTIRQDLCGQQSHTGSSSNEAVSLFLTITSTKQIHKNCIMLRTILLLQCIHGKWAVDGIHRHACDHNLHLSIYPLVQISVTPT
jgi:hypothetical protein